MGDITQALRNAQSGLLVNQQALNTVSNNVSNVNTPGYSKKVVSFENLAVAGVPAGVKISEVIRKIDEGLLKSVRIQNGKLSTLSGKEDTYKRLQELFGKPGENTSLSHLIGSLGQAAEQLAVNPGKSLESAEFVRRAQDVTDKMKSMSDAIQNLRLEADKSISDVVTQINTITGQIDKINDDIVSGSTVGRDITDLRDERDRQIDSLSKLVDIRYFYRTDGDAVIFTSGGRTLVDTVPPTLSHTAASSLAPTSTHAEGDINGIYVGTAIAGNDITTEIRDGQLKGLIDLRDNVLTDLQSQLDELAAGLRDAANQVNNRGVSFPGAQSFTGSREIVKAGTQTIKLDATNSVDDVAISLFDNNGDQTSTTTLNSIMTVATFGGTAQASRGPWTVAEMATHVQGWLQANASSSSTAAVNADGKLEIKLNTTSFNLAFRDQTASTLGSSAADASIGFDSNGDGNIDETVSGFSNFFGLNDLFQDGLSQNIFETNVLTSTFTTTAATLTFHDATTLGTAAPLGGATLTVAAGTSLADLATQITNNITDVTATVVPDGSGSRLRISHDKGAALTVTQASTDTLLTTMSLHKANTRVSSALSVRADIVNSPALISTGLPQFDSNLGAAGKYYMSVGDDSIAQNLATVFTGNNAFNVAGGLSSISSTFSQYATGILANNANLAATNENGLKTQRSLTDALQYQSDSTRGVNLDEEMADLIVFEQSYSASARVISVIQSMMKSLEQIIR